MTRPLVRGLAIAACLTLTITVVARVCCADEPPPVKEIMQKAHKEKTGVLMILQDQLIEKTPDWPAIQKNTKELVKLAETLEKTKPPRGSAKGWNQRTAEYREGTNNLAKYVDAKNQDKAQGEIGFLASRCMGCHREHKPEK